VQRKQKQKNMMKNTYCFVSYAIVGHKSVYEFILWSNIMALLNY